MSGCLIIYQASSSRWALAAIDGTPRCTAEIWGSLHRAGGHLYCCCCCTLNTNTNKLIAAQIICSLLYLILGNVKLFILCADCGTCYMKIIRILYIQYHTFK